MRGTPMGDESKHPDATGQLELEEEALRQRVCAGPTKIGLLRAAAKRPKNIRILNKLFWNYNDNNINKMILAILNKQYE